MHLAPPLDPSSIPTSSSVTAETKKVVQKCQGESGFKLRKLNDDVGEDKAVQIDSNKNLVSEPEIALVPRTTKPTTEEETQKMSAKDQLYKLCGVRHWKAPVYECCDDDEGPSPIKLFTVKAMITIKEDSRVTVLECLGSPQQKKKIAAEQAAEAALWYLKNVGYTLETDKASGRPRQKRSASVVIDKDNEKIMVTGEECK